MELKAVVLLDKRDSLVSNIKILGRSFIELQLESLAAAGIKEIHILAGKDYLFQKDHSDYYFHNYSRQSGLIGFIQKLNLNSSILVINDNSLFSDNDLLAFIGDFKSRRLSMSAMVSDKDIDAYYFPSIENNMIKKIINEKKEKSFTGAFLIAKEVLETTGKENVKHFYEELFGWLFKNNRIINTYIPEDDFIQIDCLEAWKNENFKMLKLPIFELETPKIKDSYIGDDSEIDFTSFIEGKSYIGEKVVIGKNSLIKDSIVQSGTTIGDDCKLINTLLGENVCVGNKCLLENVTISENCRIEGNSRLKDFKLARNSIISRYSEID